MSRSRCCLLLLVLMLPIVLAPRRATAQIVNAEPMFRASTKEPWAVLVEGSLDARTGNTHQLVVGTTAAGRHRAGKHELLLTGSYNRSTALGQITVDNTFGHLRYRYWWTERLQLEAFIQAARDRFRRIALRDVVGAGPRYAVLEVGNLHWTLAASYLFEVEELDPLPGIPNGVTRVTHRLNFMSGARFDYGVFTIRQTMFLQPAADDFSNVRVLHQAELALNVTNHLSTKWSLEQYYDAIAPRPVDPLDTVLRASIKGDW